MYWPSGNESIRFLLGQQAPNNPPNAEFVGKSKLRKRLKPSDKSGLCSHPKSVLKVEHSGMSMINGPQNGLQVHSATGMDEVCCGAAGKEHHSHDCSGGSSKRVERKRCLVLLSRQWEPEEVKGLALDTLILVSQMHKEFHRFRPVRLVRKSQQEDVER